MDALEKLYLAGFPLLLIFVTAFPLSQGRVRAQPDLSTSAAICISSEAFSCPESEYRPAQSSLGVPALQFLPLMVTSVYCAFGLVWSFLRLGFIYLHEETTYQGQLSEIK